MCRCLVAALWTVLLVTCGAGYQGCGAIGCGCEVAGDNVGSGGWTCVGACGAGGVRVDRSALAVDRRRPSCGFLNAPVDFIRAGRSGASATFRDRTDTVGPPLVDECPHRKTAACWSPEARGPRPEARHRLPSAVCRLPDAPVARRRCRLASSASVDPESRSAPRRRSIPRRVYSYDRAPVAGGQPSAPCPASPLCLASPAWTAPGILEALPGFGLAPGFAPVPG
jgi:hypothetical protein